MSLEDSISATLDAELAARLNEKIQHVNDLIAQKLEYQGKFLEQRLEVIDKVHAEKILNFSVRLEEALVEIRGYKDVLQQQLSLLDSAIKKAYTRIDDINNNYTHTEAELSLVRKELQSSVTELEAMMENIQKLEDCQHDKNLEETVRANDPIRKFFEENGKRVFLFLSAGLGFYLLKNFPDFLEFLRKTGEN